MNRFYVNLDYTESPERIAEKLKVRGSKTLFLTFCMHVTGIRRLFDQASIGEFLFRLAIVFRHYDIVPKFFTNDTLVTFDDRGVKVEFCLDDIIVHIGLELWDGPTDMVERKDWIDKIEKYWENACKLAVFTNIPILDRRVIGKNKFIIGSNKPKPITEECRKNAALFANAALKTIGDDIYKYLYIRTSERRKYLEKYRAHLATKPKHIYNYEKISLRIKKKIFRHLYGSVRKHKQWFEEEVNEPNSTFALLVHLAWLWTNGYITVYEICLGEDIRGFNAEVDERIDIDLELYDGLNKIEIGINLYDTFFEYGLDRIAHLLKEK